MAEEEEDITNKVQEKSHFQLKKGTMFHKILLVQIPSRRAS